MVRLQAARATGYEADFEPSTADVDQFEEAVTRRPGRGAAMFASKVAKSQTKAAANPTNKLAPQRPALVTKTTGSGVIDQPHMGQRGIGNQATLRHPTQRVSSLTAGGRKDQTVDQDARAMSGLSWDFSKIPILPPNRPNGRQSGRPKLTVGRVDDPLRHEADRIAGQVMRMPKPNISCAPSEEEAQTLETKQVKTLGTTSVAPGIVHDIPR